MKVTVFNARPQGSRSEVVRAVLESDHLVAVKQTRREALEEACKALCPVCADRPYSISGNGKPLFETTPYATTEEHGYWRHQWLKESVENGGAECEAAALRSLLAAEGS